MATSDSESRSDLVLELAEEFLERYRQGQRPRLSEYIERHPELAAEIHEVFPAMAMMEHIALADDSLDTDATGECQRLCPKLQQLGDYRIIREVGHGGMGVVYEAEQVSLGRHVALKVLSAPMLQDSKHKLRFEREAKVAAKLHHTNIVPVFGVGDHEGTPYYVMQFIQGLGLDALRDELKRLHTGTKALPSKNSGDAPETLIEENTAADVARSLMTGRFENGLPNVFEPKAEIEPTAPIANTIPRHETELNPCRLNDSTAPTTSSVSVLAQGHSSNGHTKSKRWTYWHGVARIGAQAADALDYAHKQGILHRDIKPSNLLLDTQGTVWVADFGLAKADDQQSLTFTGDILGTLRYMPPEAFEGKSDCRGDVYSLGLTLYELLAFRPAFDEKERGRLVRQVTNERPPSLRKLNPEVPRDLETIIEKAIDRDPAHRYASSAELADDLRRFIQDEPIHARPLNQWVRIAKWAKRRPAIAALIALVHLLLATSLGVLIWSYLTIQGSLVEARTARDRADNLARNERLALAEAKAQTKIATERADELRRSDYISRVNLAFRESHENNVARALELLDACPEDLRGWEWEYVRRQCRLELHSFRDAESSVNAVAFSPDGRLVATGSGDFLSPIEGSLGDVVVRDAMTGAEVFARRDLPHGTRAVAFSPDGLLLAVGHANDLVVWELASGQERFRRTESGLKVGVVALAFSPDGRSILAGYGTFNRGGFRGNARLLNAETGAAIGEPLRGGNDGIWGVAFSPDGRQVALTMSGGVQIRDVETRKLVHDIRFHRGFVYAVAFSPDGRFIASCGVDRTVRLYDRQTGAPVRTLAGHEGFVRSIAFSPDSRRLISGAEDRTIKLWSVDSDRELATLCGHTHFVQAVAFNIDGYRVASAGLNGEVKLWFASPSLQLTYPYHDGWVTGLAFRPDGRHVASAMGQMPGGIDRRTAFWDPETGEVDFFLPTDSSRDLAFTPDGRRLATGGQAPRVWNLETRMPLRTFPGRSSTWSIAFSPDGRRLATGGGSDRSIRIWEAGSGQLLQEFKDVGVYVSGLAFSPDGKLLAANDTSIEAKGLVVRVWDVESGSQVHRLKGHTFRVEDVAFFPDGRRLVSVGGEALGVRSEIKVWDLATGRLIRDLGGHTGVVFTAVFSPDGRRLATGSDDRTIKLWDTATLDEVFTLRGHKAGVVSLAFSPDGRRLVSGSIDRTARVWDLQTPTLKTLYRREAVSVARQLSEALIEPARVAEAIRSDVTLSKPIRDAALDIAGRFPGHQAVSRPPRSEKGGSE